MAEETEGLAQFNRHVAEARALDKKSVAQVIVDPVLALQNVSAGVDAVSGVGAARLRNELPAFDAALLSRAKELALAFAYAARRAAQVEGPKVVGDIKDATEARAILLAAANAAARAGLVPLAKVKKIQEGRGPIDVARDCVDLAALFTEHAEALRGKTPVTAADARRAGELGARLLGTLRPKGKKAERSPEQKDAGRDRDALGTLLSRTYAEVRRAAGWLFGDEADTIAPRLGSRSDARKKAKPAAPPA